jgi:hypothetical protein
VLQTSEMYVRFELWTCPFTMVSHTGYLRKAASAVLEGEGVGLEKATACVVHGIPEESSECSAGR